MQVTLHATRQTHHGASALEKEYTPADSPEYSNEAESATAMVEQAALAARIQTKELHDEDVLVRMWAEPYRWAADP